MSFRIKRNDNVIVLAGKDKGKTGKIIYVNPRLGYVKVENLNMVTLHKKARSAQEQAGIRKMEGNIHISNVMIICPECSQPTRIGVKLQDGKRIRVCKKCGGGLEVKVEKPKKGKKEKVERTSKSSTSTSSRVRRTRKSKAEEAVAEEKVDAIDQVEETEASVEKVESTVKAKTRAKKEAKTEEQTAPKAEETNGEEN